jgi:AAA domain (dynein-related subfamily)
MTATNQKVKQVVDASERHGHDSIIVLSGVAGTGKTYVAALAAAELSGHPVFVRQIQFHASYSYEDFIEGFRPTASGGFDVQPGALLSWSRQALKDPGHRYVLLIEELTRANLPTVLGELMTYVEYRNTTFLLPISRQRASVAPNLVILATMNPRDRSALEVDEALIRRLRIIDCPSDNDQLREMLESSLPRSGDPDAGRKIVDELCALFDGVKAAHADTYETEMPFGHGVFAGVTGVEDLVDLWHQRIKHFLHRPLMLPHPYAETIWSLYPWAQLGKAGEAGAAVAPAAAGSGGEPATSAGTTTELGSQPPRVSGET